MTDRYDDLNEVWDDRAFKAFARFTDHPWRWVIGLIGVLIGLSFLGNILGIFNVYWSAERAKLTVGARVTQATYNTDNALINIGYFHSQCNTILADQQNVRNAQSTLASDQATLSRMTDSIAQQQAGMSVTQDESGLTGAKDQLSTDVREYDAKSATQTANPFKAANLPHRISINSSTGLLAGSVNCQ